MNTRSPGLWCLVPGLLLSAQLLLAEEPPIKPLPRLAAKDLPAATRARPDPVLQQYLKEPVYVRIDEHVRPESGEAPSPGVRVVENYLKEYLRRAGHTVVAGPDAAKYRIEGQVEATFLKKLLAQGVPVAWKYKGSLSLRVALVSGAEIETFAIPEVLEDNVRSEDSAYLNLRRHLSKILWDQMVSTSKVFTDPEVVALIAALVLEPGEEDTMTAEDVIRSLADLGFRAVPFLLEALTDQRIVRLPSRYPGLEPGKLDRLRVFHLADKALEEIFQKVSRMSLAIHPDDTDSLKHRHAIILGWQKEWRRFCKPYAESPNAPAPAPAPAPAANSTPPPEGAKDSRPPGR